MKTFIGFEQALELTMSTVERCGKELIPLEAATGRYLAMDVFSKVDSPSLATSRKDGFAVFSSDIAGATESSPIRLTLTDKLYAGGSPEDVQIKSGQAVQVTTGAPIPIGADAVISEEYCRRNDNQISCFNTAGPGRNILQRGTDISAGDPVLTSGQRISPPAIGLLTAAGHSDVTVYRTPRVAVIASGDEVVAPGIPLRAGQLYASNMMEIRSWLNVFGISCAVEIVADRKSDIEAAIRRHLGRCDAFLTSGGAWGSEKDLMLKVVEKMNWQGIYHRVRMSPGKPVGYGLLDQRPFFILPGGPPSNEMAFLQLALPAIMTMMGASTPCFPMIRTRLAADVSGPESWTNFVHGDLAFDGNEYVLTPLRLPSRLKSMAIKNAIAILPEGIEEIQSGDSIQTQILP